MAVAAAENVGESGRKKPGQAQVGHFGRGVEARIDRGIGRIEGTGIGHVLVADRAGQQRVIITVGRFEIHPRDFGIDALDLKHPVVQKRGLRGVAKGQLLNGCFRSVAAQIRRQAQCGKPGGDERDGNPAQ